MNELIEIENGLRIRQGEIEFPKFDYYKAMARSVASAVNAMEPTEENLTEAREMLARSRKVTDGLNRVRIELKNKLLEPYAAFEHQVTEICEPIEEAECSVRAKVKQLDELKRQEKQDALKEIFDKRAAWYQFPKARPDAFDLWLEPKYLTRSITASRAEADMVEWLEAREKDMEAAQAIGDDCLAEYIRLADLPKAIRATHPVSPADDYTIRITLTGYVNAQKVKQFLKENDIKFESEVLD